MSFTPRIHENGGICCSNPAGMCDTCKAYHNAFNAVAGRSRSPAAHDDHRDDDPPSGYASVLDNRTPGQSDIEPDFDPSYRPYGAAPDSYKLALALRQISKEDS
jgi:hypothetical protein